ncbi:MAG: leucine-rich repeat domain-containing protein [Mycoplasmoidaceae bacterium]|nr:leucine-rich repeat domain-containing protein [Mycoplasmoidaceae bacterium]
MPESIEHIGDHAFMGTKLSGTLNIPGELTIGTSAFSNSLFNKVVIQEGKISFGSRFMAGNDSLTEIDLSNVNFSNVKRD